MKIAIYGRPFNEPSVIPYIQQVFDNLAHHNVEIYVHHLLNEYLKDQIKGVVSNVLNRSD